MADMGFDMAKEIIIIMINRGNVTITRFKCC